MARILLLEQDSRWQKQIEEAVSPVHHLSCCPESGEVPSRLRKRDYDVVLLSLPSTDRLNISAMLSQIRSVSPFTPVVVMSEATKPSIIVKSVKEGAFDFITRPFQREEILLAIEKALEAWSLRNEIDYLRHEQDVIYNFDSIVAESPSMKKTIAMLRKFSQADSTILLTGETGTGKSFLSGAVHFNSRRRKRPFIKINCANIPEGLLESELFGHEKGAFTGANKTRMGRLEQGNGGTVFLDEIGEMTQGLQARLLRVLEEKSFERVGGNKTIHSDVRIICATNRDLEAEVAAGRFREDLLYRIKIVEITLPPLRRRPTDIPLLWEHFTLLHAGEGLVSEPDLLAELERLPWRGNVRELRNLNQRLVLMRAGDSLTLADLRRLAPDAGGSAPSPHYDDAPDEATDGEGGLPLGPMPPGGFSLIELEKEIIRRALDLCDGNRTRTAQYLGIPRHVLIYRLSKYGIG